SIKGKRLATTLQSVFGKKYNVHQPNRGFNGTVSGRELYVLKNTQVVGAFLELGNIQNKRDQQRLVMSGNRQALARWIADGLAADYKKEKK
ncbi:MAG: N-acetylmuramoyl-L-alanine amidase family protein, partial [Phocaeicola sp.]